MLWLLRDLVFLQRAELFLGIVPFLTSRVYIGKGMFVCAGGMRQSLLDDTKLFFRYLSPRREEKAESKISPIILCWPFGSSGAWRICALGTVAAGGSYQWDSMAVVTLNSWSGDPFLHDCLQDAQASNVCPAVLLCMLMWGWWVALLVVGKWKPGNDELCAFYHISLWLGF